MSEKSTANTKIRRGVVLKNKMDKTVVVEVSRSYKHKKYPKVLKQRDRYQAHDHDNSCSVGDLVIIEEIRPLSKMKRWRVTEIVKKTTGV